MNINEIKNRISELKKDLSDEGDGEIKEGSLKSFLAFVDWAWLNGIYDNPAISLTPQNEIYATWGPYSKRHSFLFRADGTLKHIHHFAAAVKLIEEDKK